MSNEAIPNQVPEWRAVLIKIAAARGGRAAEMLDADLVQAVHLEFERAGSPVAGFHHVSASVRASDGTTFSRVVVINAQGSALLVDAPTEAEALGRALLQHLGASPSVYLSSTNSDKRHYVCEKLGAALKRLVSEYAGASGDVSRFMEEVLRLESTQFSPPVSC